MRPLVIVRPEPGATATAEAAKRLGVPVVIAPLFRIEPVAWTAPEGGRFDALLVTSANGVRFAGAELARLRGLPAHCVGEATASAAREAGLTVDIVGNSGVDSLLEQIPTSQRLLHLCGVDRRSASGRGHAIMEIPVYESAPLPAPQALQTLAAGVFVIHSPRAGARLRELAGSTIDLANFALAAISTTAAEAAGRGWQQVEIAAEASDSALLAIAARLCHKDG
jgi:uroporphyrinogen-III synthase